MGAARGAIALLACLGVALSARGSPGATDDAQAALVAAGQRIYRDGILPSGRALEGIAQAAQTRTGADAACIACHRRSGYGSSEGRIEIRSITGPSLFGTQAPRPMDVDGAPAASAADRSGALRDARASARDNRLALFAGRRQRPAYDAATLAAAIRTGVDVTGRKLDAGMPRYALADDELEALAAYLRTLSAHSSPGVTGEAVHFATVILPDADPDRSRAMLEVMRAYFDDRNAGMRAESRREQAGAVRLGRRFREWVLHAWHLTGPAATWPQQLEEYDRLQPAFALVGGMGESSWRPIHEFSERRGIPCIFPQTELPVAEDAGFYTVYLSKGIALEAQALAKFLRDEGERGPVLQVFGAQEASAAAAGAFRSAWEAAGGSRLEDLLLPAQPGESAWHHFDEAAARATLVLWLSPRDLSAAIARIGGRTQAGRLYLSSTLLGGRASPGLRLPAGARLVYPQELPARRAERVRRVERWLAGRGIALADEKVQLDAYLAATVVAGVMSHAMDAFSREYLVERIEHMMGNGFESSRYPRLSLGPGQRFASKGSYVVEPAGEAGAAPRPVGGWIVP